MKFYVQFYTRNLKDHIVELCGSDGVFILDGRNKLSTMIQDAKERIFKLRFIHPNLKLFTINEGNLKDYTIIYSNFNKDLLS